MIKKLQRRFIRIAVITLTIAMVLVVGLVNLANWISVRAELSETLSFLAENGGADLRDPLEPRLMGKNRHTRNIVSESRWFSAFLDGNGAIRMLNLSNMNETNEQTARALTEQALARGVSSGFLQDYLYQIAASKDGGRTVLFLHCETRITAVRTLALISAGACAGGILLAWLLVTLASRKAVEPTIRNMEQQKQFITDASHELKTPLTVISTNMELLQMETPDNAWVRSTQKQTAQMRHLVDELVYLSRMEEESAPLALENLPLNPLLADTAEPFIAMAEFQGRDMRLLTEENLHISGDEPSIRRLISTLCDNAVKYAEGEGPILVEAAAEGRFVRLSVSNGVKEPLTPAQCEALFRRFYRADPSRSKEKQSGFGIGLAIAAAIAEKHGGSIRAAMEDGGRLRITCLLPRGGKAS